ncbi:MAG TPA: pyrroline-5-carboxylate reductase [Nitrospiria bacterium]
MSEKLNRKIGVIGAGKMGSAMIHGIFKAGVSSYHQITASDEVPGALSALKRETGVTIALDNREVVKASDILILAVKPNRVRPVLEGIRENLTSKHLIISVAAGIPIALIGEASGSKTPVIRVMPNTPSLIGVGASAYALGRRVKEKDIAAAKMILEAMGLAVELPEKYMDAVTGLSGSGPAFVFMMIQAMVDGGVKMGLPPTIALKLAAQTVMGAGKMVLETKKSPAELREQVSSPGGTTVAGIASLEEADFRKVVMDAVEAAAKRSAELGKEQ